MGLHILSGLQDEPVTSLDSFQESIPSSRLLLAVRRMHLTGGCPPWDTQWTLCPLMATNTIRPSCPYTTETHFEKHATDYERILQDPESDMCRDRPQSAFPIQIKGQVRLVGSAR